MSRYNAGHNSEKLDLGGSGRAAPLRCKKASAIETHAIKHLAWAWLVAVALALGCSHGLWPCTWPGPVAMAMAFGGSLFAVSGKALAAGRGFLHWEA